MTALEPIWDKNNDIIVSGGEPLLTKGLFALISHAKQLGYKISLITNAYLVDAEAANRIAEAGLWRICISLESPDEKIHDFLRGKNGSFKHVMRAVELLNRHCPSVGVNVQAVINAVNLKHLIPLANMALNDCRIEYIYYQALTRPLGSRVDEPWHKHGAYENLWPQDSEEVDAVVNGLIALRKTNKKIVNSTAQFEVYKAYFRNPGYFSTGANCDLGERDININPQGDIFLCFAQEPLGNIATDNIVEVWRSTKADKLRQAMQRCKKQCHFLLNCSFDPKNSIEVLTA